jgi:hypothetical protein
VGLERFSGWRGSLPGGCSGRGRGDGGGPQRAELAGAEQPERRGSGTRGAGQEGREEKWDGHGLEKLVDRRTEAKRECSVRAMAAARWWRQSRKAALGEEQSGVVRAGRARREGARAALKLGAMRGGEGKQEVERQ